MGRIEKTVFISYRRTNFYTALAIYQDLTQHGYDVFLIIKVLTAEILKKIIIENIKARAHFVVVLSPSALERCKDPGDWLRREIEMAIEVNRNIVPLMMEGFDFGSPAVIQALSGKLASLNSYNGMRLYADYFFEALEKLRQRYLNVALEDIVLHTLTEAAKETTNTRKIAANESTPVESSQLTAEEWFEKGYIFLEAKNLEEAIRCYDEAINLKPDFADAYYNRGVARSANNDLKGALADYDTAIRLKPDFAEAYRDRGTAHRIISNLDEATKDYEEAIRLRSDDVIARPSLMSILRKLGRNADAEIHEKITRVLIQKEKEYTVLKKGINMNRNPTIVFVCEHGAAKSIIAAAYFNKLAQEANSEVRAIARGTHPDSELSPKAITGLRDDGLTTTESVPQKLSFADVESAQRIIAFCELPAEYQSKARVEYWDGVHPVGEDYQKARDEIVERINGLLKQ